MANIKSLQGQDDEFEDAYDAILNAYDRWLQLDISTRVAHCVLQMSASTGSMQVFLVRKLIDDEATVYHS